jgi:CRISPR-associated protein Csx17
MKGLVFTGTSTRCLGDLLKGYGIIAVVGEANPETLFFWNDAFHLATPESALDVARIIRESLPKWALHVAEKFRPTRRRTCGRPLPCPLHGRNFERRGKLRCQFVLQASDASILKRAREHDSLPSDLAEIGRAFALPGTGSDKAELHPAYWREASGNYFVQLEKAAGAAKPSDLDWCLFARGAPQLTKVLESGYLFFPEAMKRYAIGSSEWVRDDSTVVTPWCYLLALRGASLLRGSIRRPRVSRRRYPAFPFAFDGALDPELHLPTWNQQHARTLAEFQMQLRQFQARLGSSSFAATAAEFRCAVQGRGAGAAFDTFHRFVFERRRPGQKEEQRLPQAVSRGWTRPGRAGGPNLRFLVAPLGESAWVDQFSSRDLNRHRTMRECRDTLDEALNRAVDEATPESLRGVLRAVWQLDQELVSGKLRRAFEDDKRRPRPAPPLPATLWEEALRDELQLSGAYRLGRALGSVLGVRSLAGSAVGPLLEHLLPLHYDWGGQTWELPDPEPSRPYRWSCLNPQREFGALLLQRCRDSQKLDFVPFRAGRTAPLEDVIKLLRGEIDIADVHRLTALFALLDWQNQRTAGSVPVSQPVNTRSSLPVPPAYAALRLWFELGIRPSGARPPRDGAVVRLISIGGRSQVENAVELALARLRSSGLPWPDTPPPMGKAVARFGCSVSEQEAERMAVAVMVPISEFSTHTLARSLWVPFNQPECEAWQTSNSTTSINTTGSSSPQTSNP